MSRQYYRLRQIERQIFFDEYTVFLKNKGTSEAEIKIALDNLDEFRRSKNKNQKVVHSTKVLSKIIEGNNNSFLNGVLDASDCESEDELHLWRPIDSQRSRQTQFINPPQNFTPIPQRFENKFEEEEISYAINDYKFIFKTKEEKSAFLSKVWKTPNTLDNSVISAQLKKQNSIQSSPNTMMQTVGGYAKKAAIAVPVALAAGYATKKVYDHVTNNQTDWSRVFSTSPTEVSTPVEPSSSSLQQNLPALMSTPSVEFIDKKDSNVYTKEKALQELESLFESKGLKMNIFDLNKYISEDYYGRIDIKEESLPWNKPKVDIADLNDFESVIGSDFVPINKEQIKKLSTSSIEIKKEEVKELHFDLEIRQGFVDAFKYHITQKPFHSRDSALKALIDFAISKKLVRNLRFQIIDVITERNGLFEITRE